MMELPEAYRNEINSLLPPEEAAAYFAALGEPPCHGIRLNGRKGSVQELESLLVRSGLFQKAGMKKIPWISNGYSIEDVQSVSAHPYYRAGLYYIQEPSAMTPAENLPVRPQDRVLDLCAAPGGKATQLGSCLSEEGFLLANDISASRAKALVKNLEMAGIANFCVTAEDPARLSEEYPGFFDRILLDAPCSGEGMFRRDPKAVNSWLQKGPAVYAPVQGSLLESAYRMLAPGGMLLYSTCTFSTLENEQQILALLDRHSDLAVRRIPPYTGFSEGKCDLPGAVRIYPHKMRGEGHFLCLLERSSDPAETDRKPKRTADERWALPFRKLPDPVRDFLGQTCMNPEKGRFFCDQDRYYYLHENVSRMERLRYLRTGLLLGTLKKGRFEPSQALAMALSPDSYADCLSLESGDPLVEKYLRGESFPDPSAGRKGNAWILFCADGYPLGWLKASGGILKNKYEPSWRKL